VPMLTLGEAARHCGVPKSTISRAVKSGRLSAGRDDKGSYSIDPAELFRVYPMKTAEAVAATAATDSVDGGVVQDAIPVPASDATPLLVRNAQLEEQIKGLQAIVEMERQRVEEARQRAEEFKAERDRWANALEASQRQITHLAEKRSGWWPFRRGA
jgi:hypothetical protein